MEKILLIAFILMGAALNATVISAWTFENTLSPSTGSGSVSLIGGVTDDGFNTGYNGGLAWSTTSYPAQGTNNTTAGIVINVSTANFQNITISWALRHSNKSANKAVLFYTLDRTVSEPVWIQADIYNAALLAINNIPWINGFISSGFFPPVILQDKSSSIYGKPAGDVLWYWFPKMVSNN